MQTISKKTGHKNYDVIIVGASFAGLSVASKLKGNVLLVDRNQIGRLQISACAAPYDVLKEMGISDSVLQVVDTFSLHVNKKTIDFHLRRPYCTFDYAKFCSLLNLKNKAEFLKADVISVEKAGFFIVHTSKGSFSSKILVDATGWSACIAEMLRPGYVSNDMLSFGIETELPYMCKNVHFFYDTSLIKDGISWLFPCGDFSRFGVASYTGARNLINKLDTFLGRYNLKRQKIHGGFLCYYFKEPVVEGTFVVGCAQGQTLPLTGEGIRRCIRYGRKCGEIIQNILEGRMDLENGLNKYTSFALKVKRGYKLLLALQNRFIETPEKTIEILASIASNRVVFPFLERYYQKI